MENQDLKHFFEACPCPIIGVTGTKGKSTTAGLIYEMLRFSGKDVYLSGLEGEYDFGFLDKLTHQSFVVLELGSAELQGMDRSPHIAVMLGVTIDHLDDDEEVRNYVDAKRNILKFQNEDDFAILNRDYPATNESDIHTGAKVFYVSREREVDEGCFIKEKNSVVLRGIGGVEEAVVADVKKIFLRGKHDWENVCTAVAASMLAGATTDAIRKVLVSGNNKSKMKEKKESIYTARH